jgi:hypothetical protein
MINQRVKILPKGLLISFSTLSCLTLHCHPINSRELLLILVLYSLRRRRYGNPKRPLIPHWRKKAQLSRRESQTRKQPQRICADQGARGEGSRILVGSGWVVEWEPGGGGGCLEGEGGFLD